MSAAEPCSGALMAERLKPLRLIILLLAIVLGDNSDGLKWFRQNLVHVQFDGYVPYSRARPDNVGSISQYSHAILHG